MGFAVTTYPGQTPIVGLLSAQVSSSQDLLNLTLDQTTLGVNSERYNQMLVPCQVMDGKVIGFLTDITSDKNSIISLGNLSNFLTHPIYYSSEGDASTATTSLYNNVLSSVEIYSNLNFVGSAITEASTFTVGTALTKARWCLVHCLTPLCLNRSLSFCFSTLCSRSRLRSRSLKIS